MLKVVPADLTAYKDKWGLVTKNGDGGDTTANEFTIVYCLQQAGLPHKDAAEHALKLCWAFEIPVRHPNPMKWYSAQDRLSRDQFTPLLCYLAASKHPRFFELLWLHAKRRFLFTWNTKRNFVYPTLEEHLQRSTPDVPWNYKSKLPDLTFADIWAIEARGVLLRLPKVLQWLAVPVLSILDLQTFFAVLGSRALNKLGLPLSHDARNATLKVHFCANHIPTPVSWVTGKLWNRKFRQPLHDSFWTQPEEPPIHTYMSLLK